MCGLYIDVQCMYYTYFILISPYVTLPWLLPWCIVTMQLMRTAVLYGCIVISVFCSSPSETQSQCRCYGNQRECTCASCSVCVCSSPSCSTRLLFLGVCQNRQVRLWSIAERGGDTVTCVYVRYITVMLLCSFAACQVNHQRIFYKSHCTGAHVRGGIHFMQLSAVLIKAQQQRRVC